MALVLSNDSIAQGVFFMRLQLEAGEYEPLPGQFYMVRAWDMQPLLSRPLSVFNYEEESRTLSFLYQIVGKGTELLARVGNFSRLRLDGPNGNGFPLPDADLCLVGGGIGIAPLYYLCRAMRERYPNRKIRALLGFSAEPFALNFFRDVCDTLVVDVGGFVTDRLEVAPGEVVMTCGPSPMMRAVNMRVPAENDVYVSLEARMACGLGACLGCVRDEPLIFERAPESEFPVRAVSVANVHIKVCTEGPVFKREVIE